ncbi:MAG: helix-turn-helix transcriptional regulator [Oscillospiraceae bacterium]|jgi:transcriptional regulator with XRE-family HTH domain|nr:helix-turn-helix transcriptional regulator [Oscillospiraceae bacterium]
MNAKLLKRMMRTQGYSQEKLAETIGVNRCTLNRKINGVRAGFTLAEAFAAAHALGLSRADFDRVFVDDYEKQKEDVNEQKTKAQRTQP